MARTTQTIRFAAPLKGVQLRRLPQDSAGVYALMREREERSFERGHQTAENSFSQQLVSQRNEMLEIQNGVLKSIQSAIPGVIRETEQMLVQLAVATAERLVAGMPIDQETVESAIREALQQVEDGSSVNLLLHREDLALLEKGESELLKASVGAGTMRVEASSEVTRGGCVVRTRFGEIDARRETKLEQVKEALKE